MTNKKRARRERPAEPSSFPALPFVSPREHGRAHYWTVPPVGGPVEHYPEAERTGREYALQFVQWLQANPGIAGMGILGWIASDIDYKAPDRSGYWVGFFACIECLLMERGPAF
ncbi:hypothetical protein ACHZ97_11215 [Lysobacter soli]|uniref:hypothetical protein n=1 Tax=Lysobacter soli TaxID=453783 RepID=UPI0037C77956